MKPDTSWRPFFHQLDDGQKGKGALSTKDLEAIVAPFDLYPTAAQAAQCLRYYLEQSEAGRAALFTDLVLHSTKAVITERSA